MKKEPIDDFTLTCRGKVSPLFPFCGNPMSFDTVPMNLLANYQQPLSTFQIVSTWRSGSSFLTALLSSFPASYAHYEPLLPLRIIQIRDMKDERAAMAVEWVKELFKCNFNNKGNISYGSCC